MPFLAGRQALWDGGLRVSVCGQNMRFRVYSPPQVDSIWLSVYYNRFPIYPIFYLLKGTIAGPIMTITPELIPDDGLWRKQSRRAGIRFGSETSESTIMGIRG